MTAGPDVASGWFTTIYQRGGNGGTEVPFNVTIWNDESPAEAASRFCLLRYLDGVDCERFALGMAARALGGGTLNEAMEAEVREAIGALLPSSWDDIKVTENLFVCSHERYARAAMFPPSRRLVHFLDTCSPSPHASPQTPRFFANP